MAQLSARIPQPCWVTVRRVDALRCAPQSESRSHASTMATWLCRSTSSQMVSSVTGEGSAASPRRRTWHDSTFSSSSYAPCSPTHWQGGSSQSRGSRGGVAPVLGREWWLHSGSVKPAQHSSAQLSAAHLWLCRRSGGASGAATDRMDVQRVRSSVQWSALSGAGPRLSAGSSGRSPHSIKLGCPLSSCGSVVGHCGCVHTTSTASASSCHTGVCWALLSCSTSAEGSPAITRLGSLPSATAPSCLTLLRGCSLTDTSSGCGEGRESEATLSRQLTRRPLARLCAPPVPSRRYRSGRATRLLFGLLSPRVRSRTASLWRSRHRPSSPARQHPAPPLPSRRTHLPHQHLSHQRTHLCPHQAPLHRHHPHRGTLSLPPRRARLPRPPPPPPPRSAVTSDDLSCGCTRAVSGCTVWVRSCTAPA